jgi:hypothetical protein
VQIVRNRLGSTAFTSPLCQHNSNPCWQEAPPNCLEDYGHSGNCQHLSESRLPSERLFAGDSQTICVCPEEVE